MVVMEFRDGKVDVNIVEELQKYSFNEAKWTPTRLICASPFRDDHEPSFFVDLESGGWGDSGAYTLEDKSGNFVDLIMRLNKLGKSEAIEYLMEEHTVVYAIREGQRISIEKPRVHRLEKRDKKAQAELDEVLKSLVVSYSPYLAKRGIYEMVQTDFEIGYNKGVDYHTAIPWHSVDGRIEAIKYRSVRDKKFFYQKGGIPVSNLLYGAHLKGKMKDFVIVVEGEIDAMSFWQAGLPAVAVGGSGFNDNQADLLMKLGVGHIVLGGDNDRQGKALNKRVYNKLKDFATFSELDYGIYSDANDALVDKHEEALFSIFERRKKIRKIRLFEN